MAIKDPRVRSDFDSIHESIKKVDSYKGDAEIASYLCGFLAVKICGVYEDCIEHLICQRAARATDTEVYQYVKSSIAESFRNPKFSRIIEILSKFSSAYVDALKNGIDHKSRVALDSIVDNKNAIAHGRSSNVTLSDIKDYHSRCMPIFELLEAILA